MKNIYEIVKLGMPEISILVNYSQRAKNYSIHISNINNMAKLTIPINGSYHQAITFAKSRETWIRNKLANHLPEMSPEFGSELLYQGQKLIIKKSKDRLVYKDGNGLYVSCESNQLQGKLKGFLKSQARDHLDFISKKYSSVLGKKYNRLTLRDTRSRWGSCTSKGHLMYSWRLIMAPPEVLNYVAAHEVSHLLHLNHSNQFWDTVSYLMPDFKYHKDWLKKNGQSLHRYKL